MKVTLLQRKTPGDHNLAEVIDQISSLLTTIAPDVLVGPEYLFSHSERLYTEEEKSKILKQLEELTHGSDTLLIPGSIIWKYNYLYKNTVPIIHQGRTLTTIDKLSARAIDGGFCRRNGVEYLDSKDSLKRGLWLDDYLKSHSVNVRGKDLLVEICDDHYFRVENITEAPKVADLQVIVSCQKTHHFTAPVQKLFLREGGILIECNGKKPSSYIAKIVNGQLYQGYESPLPVQNDFVSVIF